MEQLESNGAPVEIVCKNNGSIKISGNFVLKDAYGNVFDSGGRQSISLCRCGHSKNKPFCDGAHREAGFESEIRFSKETGWL